MLPMNDRKIYVIGDTHFAHSNILKFKRNDGSPLRDFKTIKEHDDFIVDCWNSVVNPNDIVYHLGDVYFGNADYAASLLSKLNGRKRLLLGNHDNGKSAILQTHFQKIGMWRMFSEYSIVLSHVPIFIGDDYKGRYTHNVHGHIHYNQSPTDKHINASCEAINYTPINIEEIYERYIQTT
jgi:calcineurin-like phosphoesterase family protein